MAKVNIINRLSATEALFLCTLHAAQAQKPNGVSADKIGYTSQVKWMVVEMTKKFPKGRWTAKLLSRWLMATRKASLLEKQKKSGCKIEVPDFAVDDDVEECVVGGVKDLTAKESAGVEAEALTSEPEEDEDDQ